MLTPTDPVVKSSNRKALIAAQFSDQRHRLHAEAATDAGQASPYWPKLRDGYFRETIASPSVFQLFVRQIVWPLVSVELVDDISDSSAAVHYAQDRFIGVELRDEKLQADFEQYLEKIDLNGFITRDCHNQLFSGPSALVVVDLPETQTTPFPEPYIYVLPTSQIDKAEASENGLMKWVLLKPDEAKRVALFDSTDYGVFQKNAAGEWVPVVSEPHGLEYTPAFKMWADTGLNNPLLSNSILSPILGLLDRYVLWDGAREVNDLGAGFQMFWHFEEERKSCGLIVDGSECQNGSIYYVSGESSKRIDCPRCGGKKVSWGPGRRIPIPAPQNKSEADWRDPAGYISPKVEALKYVAEKVTGLKAAIKSTATGQQVGPENKQALNEDQIFSILEASRRVGQYLATNYEILHRRAIDTIGRLRYGDAYIGCSVNYGRRFSVLTGDQLMLLYESAKKIGAVWLLEEIDGMLQDYYSRGDASRKLRFKLLTDLNPYKFMSPADLVNAEINTSDPVGYRLSVKLMRYVRQFESENKVPIERFGILIDYSDRVTTIFETLTEYVNKELSASEPIDGESDPDDPTGDDPASDGNKPGSGKPANRRGGSGKRSGKGASAKQSSDRRADE